MAVVVMAVVVSSAFRKSPTSVVSFAFLQKSVPLKCFVFSLTARGSVAQARHKDYPKDPVILKILRSY